MKKYLNYTCCLGVIFMRILNGQEATNESKPNNSGRRAWVVATTMPDDVLNPLKVLANDKLQKVKIYMRSMGHPVKVGATGEVNAVKEILSEDGGITYKNLSMSVIPEGVREALIVLVPGDKDDEGLRFKSKVIDLDKFKKGGFLYVNLVKTKIGITLGEQKTVVSPGGMKFINPLHKKEKGVFVVRFFYETPNADNANWKLMTSSKMAVYKSRREICIFYYNESIDNVDFRGIPFITPLPEPKKVQP